MTTEMAGCLSVLSRCEASNAFRKDRGVHVPGRGETGEQAPVCWEQAPSPCRAGCAVRAGALPACAGQRGSPRAR